MKLADFVRRADELIAQAEAVHKTARRLENGSTYVDAGQFAGLRAGSLSFLRNTFSSEHPYYAEFDTGVNGTIEHCVLRGIGILKAVREELAGGWTQSARGIVSAEVFADFMEMADHLLSEGYKDPAAVMIGSVLEEHLRQLCRREGIDVELVVNNRVSPKKADVLNADLAKAGVYGKLEQKLVTAWLDLRNKAAHGHYGEYAKEQVQLMYQGVLDFTVRFHV